MTIRPGYLFIAFLLIYGNRMNGQFSDFKLYRENPEVFQKSPEDGLQVFLDSIPKKRGIRKLFYFIKPVINIGGKRSFFLQRWVKLNGIRLGFEMVEKYRFGWSFFNSDPIYLGQNEKDGKTFNLNMHFAYSSTFTDFVFHENYKWEFSANGSLGLGEGTLTIKAVDSSSIHFTKTGVFPVFELGGAVEYKIYPWLGIAGGVGGRQVFPELSGIQNSSEIKRAFDGSVYAFAVKIHFGQLFKYFFNRTDYKADKARWKNRKKNTED